ncbi:hypothetical protein GCM10018785_33270 [Streptomyces longispororuber]|uniref:Uncharacterized protein n=1 Tax=Streptomyces longispororuber TaxID=68230 RepID=A0A919DN64_9ACTN|nr:hypothetical protein [Streptomyces longispororuber]GHE61626.1 hypothetical protein GCM10018785_33270 [Streptomyces longispororuber]
MPTEPKKDSQKITQGWRMDPIPSRAAYRDGEGNIRVPVWLTKNGRHVADTEMVLLPSEAALLADNLTHAMRDDSRSMLHELLRDSATALGAGVVYVSKPDQYQL